MQTVAGNVVEGTFNASQFAGNLLAMAGRNLVSAGVSSAINGTSFDAAFQNGFVSDLAAVGANAVGQTWSELTAANILAHAGLGCAAAAANGADCGSGALGGATSALVNPLIDPLTTPEARPPARSNT